MKTGWRSGLASLCTVPSFLAWARILFEMEISWAVRQGKSQHFLFQKIKNQFIFFLFEKWEREKRVSIYGFTPPSPCLSSPHCSFLIQAPLFRPPGILMSKTAEKRAENFKPCWEKEDKRLSYPITIHCTFLHFLPFLFFSFNEKLKEKTSVLEIEI